MGRDKIVTPPLNLVTLTVTPMTPRGHKLAKGQGVGCQKAATALHVRQ